MRGLLEYSLERISSLQYFYNLEKESIERKSKKGMKENRFGFLMDMYFQTLTIGKEADRQKESFLRLKEQADQYIELISAPSKENNAVKDMIIYRIKNAAELSKKGFNLDIRRATSAYKQFADMPIIHGSNTLIMLITRFEEFISNFLSELYLLYPHKYLDKQQITFSEIESAGIEAVRKKIVAREIDSIMRESYTEWFKLFESHGMEFDSCKDQMEQLKELYARRNIWVHNSGKANEIYIKSVPNTTQTIGERLVIDEQYLNSAFGAIKIIIFTILIQAARLIKENTSDYLADIFQAAYDELAGEHYPVAYNVFYLLSQNSDLDAERRTSSQINYWIAAKEIDGLPSIKTDIEHFDVSALHKMFSLAKELLLENNDAATKIIEALYQKKELASPIIKEWPLFKDYRKSKQYDEFKRKHPEIFGMASLDTGPAALAADKEVGTSIRKEIEVAQLSD